MFSKLSGHQIYFQMQGREIEIEIEITQLSENIFVSVLPVMYNLKLAVLIEK